MSADRIISTALIIGVGLVALGWLILQALGELRLSREHTRPSSRPPDRESCLRRVDPVTGRPWSEIGDVEHRATAATIAELTARCAELEAVTRKLAAKTAQQVAS